MRAPAELTTAFRAQGLKLTPQRQLLFRLLHGNMTHPTAESLYAVATEQMPGISLRTVYQTLNDLAAMGELQVVQASGGSTRFDPNVEPHHHARCEACGALSDVYVHRLDELHVVGFDGFVSERANIVFTGLCGACKPSPTNSTPSPTNSTKEQS